MSRSAGRTRFAAANRLAVELAKLCIWIEDHAEGLPLTFLNHRLVEGDSLTGPFFEHLLTFPREPGLCMANYQKTAKT